MKVYPDYLPKPSVSGYSESIEPSIARTTMSDGYVRQRLISKHKYNTLTCSFLFTQGQYYQWTSFLQNEVNFGADWFNLPILSYDNDSQEEKIIYKTVRLQNGKYSASLKDVTKNYGQMWVVNCTFDLAWYSVKASGGTISKEDIENLDSVILSAPSVGAFLGEVK